MRLTMMFVVVAVVVAGCTGYGTYTLSDEKLPATNAKDIKVYALMDAGHDYKVVGYISVYNSDAQDAGDDLREKLKVRAAQIGANAIVAFKLNEAVSGGGGAEGIAVRFK